MQIQSHYFVLYNLFRLQRQNHLNNGLQVGYERIQEISDPEKSIDRARDNWKRHGRSEKWIQQRMMGQETRNKLTDYCGKTMK